MTDTERELRIALQKALRDKHPEDLVDSGACKSTAEALAIFGLAGIEFHYVPPYRIEKDWEHNTWIGEE